MTTNKNTLGVICLIFGLASLWRVISIYKTSAHLRIRPLSPHIAMLLMVAWLFWKANSMTSMASFLLAGSVLVLANVRSAIRRPLVLHLCVFVMVTACICILFLGIGAGVLTTVGRNPTLTDRTAVWALILQFAGNPILGTGFESFWLGPRLARIWSVYAWGPTEAHNGYIESF